MISYAHLRTPAYALLTLLIVSACSQQPPKPNASTATLRQSAEPIPNTWSINAKLGIRSPQNSGSVSLNWQQQDNEYRLRVSGPFGQGGGIISGNHESILIERSGKPSLSSDSPEELIKNTFGWDFPLRDLAYWVRGLPSPYRSNTQLAYKLDGTLTRLQQAEWSIDYDRYQVADKWLMPSTVRTEKDGVSLKLVIKRWQFSDNPTAK